MSVIDDISILDEDHVLRLVPTARIYNDENENRWKIYTDEGKPVWAFYFNDAGENLGLSVDHKERIVADAPTEDPLMAIDNYYTNALSEYKNYYSKRSVLCLSVRIVREQGLKVTSTPLENRVHHCDIWPSDNQTDFTGNQSAEIEKNYKFFNVRKA